MLAQQLRLIFAELGAPSTYPHLLLLGLTFAENGTLIDDAYNKRIIKFMKSVVCCCLKNQGQKVFHIRMIMDQESV